MLNRRVLAFFVLLVTSVSGTAQISPGQISDFQDGTTQGWSNGPTAFNQPQNIAGGGPAGADDNYLEDISDGNGSGGKLVVYNEEPEWLGNYLSEGITTIRFFARTPTGEPLTLRVGLRGGPNNTRIASVSSASIPPVLQDWVLYEISIAPADLEVVSGPDSVEEVLSEVNQIRILHNPDVDFSGVNIIAFLHLDNIEATPDVLGNPEEQNLEISVFPNPANDVLRWRSTEKIDSYLLYNVLGQVVQRGTVSGTDGSVRIADLPSGVYMLELEAGGRRSTHRIVRL